MWKRKDRSTLLFLGATAGLVGVVACGCAVGERSRASGYGLSARGGILVMAHGGGPEWNAAVNEAVRPLRDQWPVEVAFGMADAGSLEDAVRRLEMKGVRAIAVVRLFMSKYSFRERTEKILGLKPGAPEKSHSMRNSLGHDSGAGHAKHPMGFWRVRSDAVFKLSEGGLLDSPLPGDILCQRALALSRNPGRERVLLLAHGPGDDIENAYWLERMNEHAEVIRRRAAFKKVRVETLREDWPDKRRTAEKRIRDFVREANEMGDRVIVIPYRVFGFGPYREVLEGLSYVADGRGILPHPAVTEWLREKALECFKSLELEIAEDEGTRSPAEAEEQRSPLTSDNTSA